MLVRVKSWVFILFGMQGLVQVIYWEVIKGYPACLMCKGYRYLYIGIVITSVLQRYRPRLWRLDLIVCLVCTETLWSLWDVLQKIGSVAQKCRGSAMIVEGRMIFKACSPNSLYTQVLLSPTGFNALLSFIMCLYALSVGWRICSGRRVIRRGLCGLGMLSAYNVVANPTQGASDALRDALQKQERRAKKYESIVRDISKSGESIPQANTQEASNIARRTSKDARIEAQQAFRSTTSCQGKCPRFHSTADTEPKLQVCMSFSVPLQVWKDLNDDVIRYNGAFIIKGLPNNRFQAFAEKILEMRKFGITAPIRIDPKLFERLNIQQVPMIVTEDKGKMHKVSGTVSIPYVLRLLTEEAQ